MVHSPLTTRMSLSSDYDSRGGVVVDSIGHHHAAGTSLEVALQLFQPGGRTVTPNYCIRGKDIVLVVPEEFCAWTSASRQDDARSITYEIINSSAGPGWTFDPDTIASVIALDRDISKRYGIVPRHALPGYWEHRNLNEWFDRSYATACAGPSFRINEIVNAASLDTAPPAVDPLIRKRKIMSMPFLLQQSAPSPQYGVNVAVFADGTFEILDRSKRDVWLDLGCAFQNCVNPGRFEYHMQSMAEHRARTAAADAAAVEAAFAKKLEEARKNGWLATPAQIARDANVYAELTV